jgi:hypothetical protein
MSKKKNRIEFMTAAKTVIWNNRKFRNARSLNVCNNIAEETKLIFENWMQIRRTGASYAEKLEQISFSRNFQRNFEDDNEGIE